jgi:predicted lipoprotein with Yx(FWY)xxD motif
MAQHRNSGRTALLAAAILAAGLAGGPVQAEEQSLSVTDASGVPLWMRIYPTVGSPMPAPDGTPAFPPGVQLRRIAGATAYADLAGRTLYMRGGGEGAPGRDWRALAAPWTAHGFGDWSVVEQPGGGRQWALRGRPLYTYAGDVKAGDSAGDGAEGGAWQVAVLARDFRPDSVAFATIPNTNIGPTLTTADGRTLYFVAQFAFEPRGNTRYNSPSPGPAGCSGACLERWRPFAAPEGAKGEGEWGVVGRDDGSRQWTFRGHPLYTFLGDDGAGVVFGDGTADLESGTTGKFWYAAALNP